MFAGWVACLTGPGFCAAAAQRHGRGGCIAPVAGLECQLFGRQVLQDAPGSEGPGSEHGVSGGHSSPSSRSSSSSTGCSTWRRHQSSDSVAFTCLSTCSWFTSIWCLRYFTASPAPTGAVSLVALIMYAHGSSIAVAPTNRGTLAPTNRGTLAPTNRGTLEVQKARAEREGGTQTEQQSQKYISAQTEKRSQKDSSAQTEKR